MFSVLDLLRSPGYAVPLVINLTGSVWFFLLIGKAGELDFYLVLEGWVLGMVGWSGGDGNGWCLWGGES